MFIVCVIVIVNKSILFIALSREHVYTQTEGDETAIMNNQQGVVVHG